VKKVQIKRGDSFPRFEEILRDAVTNFDEPTFYELQGPDVAKADSLFLHLLWLLGKNLTIVEDHPSGACKWDRPVVCLTDHPELKRAISDRFFHILSTPEEWTGSIYDIVYIIIDADKLSDPNYSHIKYAETKIVVVVDKPLPEGVAGDVYVCVNPSVMLTFPPDKGEKLYIVPFPLFHTTDFRWLPQFNERKPFVLYLDPEVFPHELIEYYKEEVSLKMNLSSLGGDLVVGKNPPDFSQYQCVLYPVGTTVHPLFLPPRMWDALRSGGFVVTNGSAAPYFPNTLPALDVYDDYEIVPTVLTEYLESKHIVSDPEYRFHTLRLLLEKFTWEGLLLELAEGKVIKE